MILNKPRHLLAALSWFVAFVCPAARCAATVTGQDAARTVKARLKIESFASSRAYAIGQNTITLIATVRNVGDAPLPEGAVTGRLSCVSGLEYTEGDTIPKLPALDPNAVVNYHWRVTPTSNSGALVAAFALEYPDANPDVRVIGIQRFASDPNEGTPSILPTPVARARDEHAVIENGRVRARIETTESGVPGLWVSARTPSGWRRAGVSLPLSEVCSGEGGQIPWWEVFRTEEMRAVNGLKEASLVLTGGIGLRWRATIVLTLRAESSALDCDLRLAPLKPIKISGVRLAPFFAGEGGFGSEVTEELPYSVNGANAAAAVRTGDLTVGCAWPTRPLFKDWQLAPLPNVPGADYQVLGTELVTQGPPVELRPGALVDYHSRIFALAPSANVRDAFRIFVPAERSEARPAPPAARALASRHATGRMSTSRRALIIRRERASKRASSRKNKHARLKADRAAAKSRTRRAKAARARASSHHKGKGKTHGKGASHRRRRG